MQIFVRLSTGKTVTMDVTQDTKVADVIQFANMWSNDTETERPCYQAMRFSKAFYEEEHPMTVKPGDVLGQELVLRDLYVHGVIKEITLLACF